jgi:cyanophycin synthetase
VPLTLGGKAKFMIANVLAATLASYVWDSKRKILACPTNFHSKRCSTPGRMNIFEFKNSKC